MGQASPAGPSGSRETVAVGAQPVGGRRWMLARAIFLSLLLAPLCCYWAQDQGVDRIFSLTIPPVVLTLFLIVVNIPLRLWIPRLAFTGGELLLFYAMQAVICVMSGEWMDVINPYIHSYGLFASQNPQYKTKVLPYISSWLFFTEADAARLKDFAAGGNPPWYFLGRLGIWWPKILAWTGIAGLVCFAMLCINSLMRDEWSNREKLAFPLIQLPIAMTQHGGAGPFWRNRLMWGAFATIFAIDMLNGFAFLYPALPRINLRLMGDMSLWFDSPPWNQIGWTPIGIFPYMAALGMFMPTDLLFSCVFFFFVRKGLSVGAAAMGYEQGVFGGGGLVPSPPYFSEQSWGAFIGLALTALWVARNYLKEVWREIRYTGTRDSRLVPHRFAFIGLIVSLIGLGLVGIAIGLSFLFVLGYTGIFLVFSFALTRLRAQLGPPTHEMAFMGPTQLLVDFRGTQGMSPALIARTVTTFHFMNRIHRNHPMPVQFEAIKMADMERINQRGMFAAIVIATLAGSVLGHLTRVYLGYRWMPPNTGGETTSVVAQLTDSPRPANVTAIVAVAVGFIVVLLLDFIRFRVPGFPLHPAGYALAMNFGVDYYWFGLVIVLIVKGMVQRYYGLKGYDKLRMIAFGLILGEFSAEVIWAVMAMVTRQASYSVSINGRLRWDQ